MIHSKSKERFPLTALLTMPPLSQSISNRNADQNKTRQTPSEIHPISTSPKSIPDTTLMDNYSTYINRQSK